ncbi:MAG: cysteine--tRNA ligase [Patescibacteria group bacterium]
MYLYNTLSGKEELLKKPLFRSLKIFVCGPTTYDYSHIGHARTYIFFDTFVRYLKHRGFRVKYIQNITDVDDKIIERAKDEKKDPAELAGIFTKEHLRNMKDLNIESVTKYARASAYVPQILKQIKTLLKKGFAYQIPGDGYYFDVSKFGDYGKLSHRTTLEAEDAVSRIDENLKKRNKADFALWKFAKLGEPKWKTDLGDGRPGWHIEDTAITEKFFGPQYDIHGGGIDLKFPHHEAEIAQQESASGKKPFVKIWMHTGFLLVDGEKMSKSLKNFITIGDLLKDYSPNILRLLVLGHHYRSPIDYSEKLANQTRAALQTFEDFLGKIDFVLETKNRTIKNFPGQKPVKVFENLMAFALEDDFNTPQALALIFESIGQNQENVWYYEKNHLVSLKKFLESTFETLGFKPKKPVIPPEVKKFVAERELLRQNKQFALADALRNKIRVLGYEVEDTPIGPLALETSNHKHQTPNLL